ncbi:MAG: LUD domain-containing protein [Sphingobacteriales bacterium]|jgi:L-lactate dehydrogenase complex protein LldF|nr:LUD domain-containing protein [Sphingobacteriales bacterium]
MMLSVEEIPVGQTIDMQGNGWPHRARTAGERERSRREEGTRQFSNLELARERAAFIRWKAIENLDTYLIEFEANFIKSGGKVLWAQDMSDALEAVLGILKQNGGGPVIKAKTNTAQEIGLVSYLESEGVPVQETDAGDFIVQTGGEQASHMILPAMHRDAAQIAQLLSEKKGWPESAGPEELVKLIRSELREAFLKAETGITGCNFLVADPGAVVIMENEGNAQLTASLPKRHIVLAGIDKVLPSLQDLGLFLPLLSSYGTGQRLTAYNSIISGPRQADEQDGPEELYVILIDNGRSDVLAHEKQRQAMGCIRCGACQTACPVYRSVGASEFPSPVAAVTMPLQGSDHRNLSQHSTLCGSCKDVCPVKIDIPSLLLENRKLFVERGDTPKGEKWFYYAWKKSMLKRDLISWTRLNPRNKVLNGLYRSATGLRDMPLDTAGEKTFNQWYREQMNYR